eukprot:COSAG06_NODE_5769_length_3281_cov_3.323696_3_plen_209_part_00
MAGVLVLGVSWLCCRFSRSCCRSCWCWFCCPCHYPSLTGVGGMCIRDSVQQQTGSTTGMYDASLLVLGYDDAQRHAGRYCTRERGPDTGDGDGVVTSSVEEEDLGDRFDRLLCFIPIRIATWIGRCCTARLPNNNCCLLLWTCYVSFSCYWCCADNPRNLGRWFTARTTLATGPPRVAECLCVLMTYAGCAAIAGCAFYILSITPYIV